MRALFRHASSPAARRPVSPARTWPRTPRDHHASPTRPSPAATQLREQRARRATRLRDRRIADHRSRPAPGRQRRPMRARWSGRRPSSRRSATTRSGLEPVTLPEVGASQRAAPQVVGAQRAAAGADRARRQPRRHASRPRSCASPTWPRCRPRPPVRSRARSPSSTTAWNARATAAATARARKVRSRGPSAAIRAGAVGVPDAFGRHRFASQSAHRHHPLRRRPHADPVGRAGRRPTPTSSRACSRAGRCACAGARLRLGRRRRPRTT